MPWRILTGLAAAAVAAALAAQARALPATLTSPTTELTVFGGEANNGLVPSGGYFHYTDLASNEDTTWSIDPLLIRGGAVAVLSNGAAGGFGSPSSAGPGVVRSTATFGTIAVQADTMLLGAIARTTFNFTKTSPLDPPLDGTTFVFYAENDLFSFSDDVAAFLGSIGSEDLRLFQFDSVEGGLAVTLSGRGTSNASLALFGSGAWTAFGTALEAGDLSVLSATGSKFVTGGDLGLALAFNLRGNSASLVIDYQTQANPVPEPAGLGLAVLGGLLACRVRRAPRRR
jgi:hypothetical protein